MTTDSAPTLRAIEVHAERAIAQELRIMIQEVLALRPSMTLEDQAYADGLLMKLDRLLRDQLVLPACSNAAAAHSLLLARVMPPSHDPDMRDRQVA
jgi:hypothetical protein